jgi:N-acetylglucosamine kinase-like BadF-type ATPase
VTAAAILAVDGGNSKVDLLLVGADGRLIGFRRGPTISHQQVGIAPGMQRLTALATQLAADSGLVRALPIADLGAYCLAGADFPAEIRALERALEGSGLASRTLVRNDTFAALRAGASRSWGVVLICGHGVNGAAVGEDRRVARFDAVGDISGDWGGGHALGQAALAAAVRAQDGRGPGTQLQRSVPRFFGRRSIGVLVRDLYYERVSNEQLGDLAPMVFEAAEREDAVARGIVNRLADELIAMAGALIRRTRLQQAGPEVVLAGGVFRTREPGFYERLEAGIRAVAPDAKLVRLEAPPVLGAAIIGLEALGLEDTDLERAEARLRADLGDQASHARAPLRSPQ